MSSVLGNFVRSSCAAISIERHDVRRSRRGLHAQRVPLSGATEYAKGDVEVTAGFDGKTIFRGECKRRAALPEWIDKALGENDFLAMREDRGKTLIVLRLETFGDLLQ